MFCSAGVLTFYLRIAYSTLIGTVPDMDKGKGKGKGKGTIMGKGANTGSAGHVLAKSPLLSTGYIIGSQTGYIHIHIQLGSYPWSHTTG